MTGTGWPWEYPSRAYYDDKIMPPEFFLLLLMAKLQLRYSQVCRFNVSSTFQEGLRLLFSFLLFLKTACLPRNVA